MTKRTTQTKLTLYRAHAPKVCGIESSRILDQCECPIWCHGKVRGKFIRQSLNTRSLSAAMMKRDEIIARPDDPTPEDDTRIHLVKPNEDVSLAHALDDFKRTKKRKASSTQELYETAATHFIAFVETKGVVLVKDVDRKHVEEYLEMYATDRTTKGGKKGRTLSTVQSRLIQLRVFFNHCRRERHWIPYSPAESRDLNYTKKGKTARSGEMRLPFTPEEVTKVLAAVEQIPDADRDQARALVYLMLYSGMRISDATFIERAYIDRKQCLQYWIIKTRKKLAVSFWLHDLAIAALAKLPASRVYFFQPDREDDYRDARNALRNGQSFDEFMPDYKRRVDASTRLVLKVLNIAGLTGACHRFRDTFAVNLLMGSAKGEADLLTVCEFLGHSDVRITRDHYLKFVEGYAERMAQRTRVLDYQLPLAG